MRLCFRVDHIPARAHVVGTGYTRLVTVVALDMNADNNLFSPRDEIGKHKKINTIPIGEWGGGEKKVTLFRIRIRLYLPRVPHRGARATNAMQYYYNVYCTRILFINVPTRVVRKKQYSNIVSDIQMFYLIFISVPKSSITGGAGVI